MINTKLLINTIKILCLLALILITFNSCEPMYGASKHKNDCIQLEKEHKKLLEENKNLKIKIELLEKLDRKKIKIMQNLQAKNKKLLEEKK